MRAYGLLALLVGAGALVPLTALATGKYPSQGEAYAACKRMTANAAAAWQPMQCAENLYNGGGGSYYARDKTGRDVGWPSFWWASGTDCKKQPEQTGWRGEGTTVTAVCHNNCAYSLSLIHI